MEQWILQHGGWYEAIKDLGIWVGLGMAVLLGYQWARRKARLSVVSKDEEIETLKERIEGYKANITKRDQQIQALEEERDALSSQTLEGRLKPIRDELKDDNEFLAARLYVALVEDLRPVMSEACSALATTYAAQAETESDPSLRDSAIHYATLAKMCAESSSEAKQMEQLL